MKLFFSILMTSSLVMPSALALPVLKNQILGKCLVKSAGGKLEALPIKGTIEDRFYSNLSKGSAERAGFQVTHRDETCVRIECIESEDFRVAWGIKLGSEIKIRDAVTGKKTRAEIRNFDQFAFLQVITGGQEREIVCTPYEQVTYGELKKQILNR